MAQKLVQYSYKLKKQKQHNLALIITTVVSVFVVLKLVMTFLIYPVRQTSVSMQPDFPENSFVMLTPLGSNFQRGDVVLLDSRQRLQPKLYKRIANVFVSFFTARQFSLFENDSIPGTKKQLRRIVGLPGDTIYMKDYILYVKPKGEKHFLSEFEISKHTYNVTFYVPPSDWDHSIGVKGTFEPVVLSYDEYFVLSDNRKASDDSRLWGPVKKNRICARALICYFPFDKFKIFN